MTGTKRNKDGNSKNPSLVKGHRRLPKCREPPIPKTHWDYLLDEMVWLATDFYQERHWKQAAAKHFAHACQASIKESSDIFLLFGQKTLEIKFSGQYLGKNISELVTRLVKMQKLMPKIGENENVH